MSIKCGEKPLLKERESKQNVFVQKTKRPLNQCRQPLYNGFKKIQVPFQFLIDSLWPMYVMRPQEKGQ